MLCYTPLPLIISLNIHETMSFYRHHSDETFLGVMTSLIFLTLLIWNFQSAFYYLGFPPSAVLLIIWLSFLGSLINIPITYVESEGTEVVEVPVSFFGFRYVVPVYKQPNRTLIAINVGGAVIPVIIATLLLIMRPVAILYVIPGTIIAAIIIHRFAKVVPHVGIAVPFFVPPMVSALIAVIFSWGNHELAPIIAYSVGTFGSLIGADLLNLKKIPETKAPIASIGGAGTFDGVFLAGIFAVLLVAFF